MTHGLRNVCTQFQHTDTAHDSSCCHRFTGTKPGVKKYGVRNKQQKTNCLRTAGSMEFPG
jgi:hypothetical protein